MIRKIMLSLISAGVIAGTILIGFAALYFIIPNKQAMAEIRLAEQVTDAVSDTETAEDTTTQSAQQERTENIYVADVYQTLTLRSQPDSNSEPLMEEGLLPLTRLELQESVPGTNFAYVKVLDGSFKDMLGYVNTDYITKLGEPTLRVNVEE